MKTVTLYRRLGGMWVWRIMVGQQCIANGLADTQSAARMAEAGWRAANRRARKEGSE